uniref:Uncharacterized protein n=1 Tax=Setaria italica TaxID=4555 RepID=K3ZBV1_SETIT
MREPRQQVTSQSSCSGVERLTLTLAPPWPRLSPYPDNGTYA